MVCLVLSIHVITCLRISGKAIPVNKLIYLNGINLAHLVITLQVALLYRCVWCVLIDSMLGKRTQQQSKQSKH